ncbi:MAG: DUF1223 domain-containing protein [Rubripirellula sp.]
MQPDQLADSRRRWLRAASCATVGVAVSSSLRAFEPPLVSKASPSAADAFESAEVGQAADRGSDQLNIVELFTSQGCSSCPPADRVLADLVERHESEGVPAIGLSFHVDYWNHLGWQDPFSSAFWSQRQKRYANVLKDRVYTPQMIVNGQTGFVGSRRKQLDAILDQAKETAPEHQIELRAEQDAQRGVNVTYSVTGEGEGRLVNFALVARSLSATASRGENAGRTLTHANVVRDFAIRRLTEPSGELTWPTPSDAGASFAVVAYVQHAKSAMITSAVEQSLS